MTFEASYRLNIDYFSFLHFFTNIMPCQLSIFSILLVIILTILTKNMEIVQS